MPNREVFFETTRIGPYKKVTAIDSVTGIEVSVQGPVKVSDKDLQQLAINKLKLAVERQNKK
jgi:hypothetical protein